MTASRAASSDQAENPVDRVADLCMPRRVEGMAHVRHESQSTILLFLYVELESSTSRDHPVAVAVNDG
jgi:hypothetical protein